LKHYRIAMAIVALLLTAAAAPATVADGDRMRDATVQPATPPPPPRPQPQCRPGYLDPDRCPRPYPVYQRPIIIQQAAPIEEDTDEEPTDDWEGCRKQKLAELNARHGGNTSRANELEAWLWKNCRGYSNELRELE
jgi:hypothetical protein